MQQQLPMMQSRPKAREVDLLIVDTAGCLIPRKSMEELKGKRVIEREGEGCNIQVLLVLMLPLPERTNQSIIHEAIMLMLLPDQTDGTAKGGLLSIRMNWTPIKLIGVGEQQKIYGF